MDSAVYSGLWSSFGGNIYKFGPYYKQLFDIIQSYCKIEILHSADYDIDRNIYRDNIMLPQLDAAECSKFDIYSLVIVFLFCARAHINNRFSLEQEVYERVISLSEITDDAVTKILSSYEYYDIFKRYYFEDLDSKIRSYIITAEDNLDLVNYLDNFISKKQLISKTYRVIIKYMYWLEDCEENIQCDELDVLVDVTDLLDFRTMTVDDLYITRVLESCKEKYERKIINFTSTALRWRPTLEVITGNIYDYLSIYISGLNSVNVMNSTQSVYLDKPYHQDVLNTCRNLGALS